MSEASSPKPVAPEAVLRGEHGAINERRTRRKCKHVQASNTIAGMPYGASGQFDTTGLALSGGGIRSAAFCLGALQALQASKQFDSIDYLSTVSGGGYIGASLTSALSLNGGKFPFLNQESDMSDADAVGKLRDRSNYLIPDGVWDVFLNIAIVLRGLAANLLMVIPVLLLLAAATAWLYPSCDALDQAPFAFGKSIAWPLFTGRFAWTATAFVVFLGYLAAWAVYRSFFRPAAGEFGGPWIWLGAVGVLAIPLFAFLELQPLIIAKMYVVQHQSTCGTGPVASAGESTDLAEFIKYIATVFAPFLAFASLVSKKVGELLRVGEASKGFGRFSRLVIGRVFVWAAALALPVFLWSVYLLLAYWAIPNVGKGGSPEFFWEAWRIFNVPWLDFKPPFAEMYAVVAAAIIVLTWTVLVPNANSLHRLYRDRLGAAFLLAWRKDTTALTLKLSAIDTETGPYHLLNAALNIQGDKDVNMRGRNADFYTFGKLYSGSPRSGYAHTQDMEKFNPSATLATAMAISGAAVSSNMGSASIGPLAPTLALLNVRLGYWLNNPLSKRGGWSFFYLAAEMLSRLRPGDKVIYLTDGGHIENLGAYELLRRRCHRIIVIDAEADPGMNFGALVKLERYARIDLGVRINLWWNKISSTALGVRAPGAKPAHGPHCAIGEISYSNGGTGTLIYVKASLSGDENVYVRDYARRHADFPHETTGDQFFSEEQFEVYRALGFHCVRGVYKNEDPDEVETSTPGAGVKLAAERAFVPVPGYSATAPAAGPRGKPKAKRR
ncbi:MAG: patatin-like phospholipase family protein [Aestuariivirga sp.]